MRMLISILLILFIYGCIRNNKIPSGILAQNEMRKVMWDLMRADAFVSDFIMRDSTCNELAESAMLYEQVFAIHATTEEIFRKSMDFYEGRPDLLKTVMDSLRSDEKRVQENPGQIRRPTADSALRKIRMIKQPVKQK